MTRLAVNLDLGGLVVPWARLRRGRERKASVAQLTQKASLAPVSLTQAEERIMTLLYGKKRLPKSLDLKDLDLPESMSVKGISLEEDVDWDGEDTIRVTVVVADSVDLGKDGNVSGKDVLRLKDAIENEIQEYGHEEFVYVDIVSESELKEDVVDPVE